MILCVYATQNTRTIAVTAQKGPHALKFYFLRHNRRTIEVDSTMLLLLENQPYELHNL